MPVKKRSSKFVRARKRVVTRGRKRSATPARAGNVVFLAGFMGAGKTSVGQALAHRLNWVFEDLDDRIEAREGRTVAEIFRDSGESAFREAEHAALRQVVEELRGGVRRIVALGGGAFAQGNNVALLRLAGATTIFLDAPVSELWRRCCVQVEQDGAARPLLKSMDEFRRLYEARRKSYASASLKINTGQGTVEAIAEDIAKKLALKSIALHIEEGEVE